MANMQPFPPSPASPFKFCLCDTPPPEDATPAYTSTKAEFFGAWNCQAAHANTTHSDGQEPAANETDGYHHRERRHAYTYA